MANVKITELPSLSGANSVSTDVIPVVDVSADITSKMTRAEFFTNVPSIGVVGDASTISAASSSAALTITQTGAGNALVVEDSTSPDSTPFVVTAAGNVGVGTNSPSTKLAVSGGALRIDAGDAVEDALVIGAGTSGTTGEIRSVKIFANLSTSKGIQLRADNSVQRIVALNSAGLGQLTFGNSSDGGTTFNERMRITNLGNVGIGTTSPVAPLHVVGASITTGVTFSNQPTETSKSAAATLTIAELLTGIVQFTGATIGTLTLPTGTAIEGGLPTTFPTNVSFDFSVINTGTAAGAVTITGNTGLTLVGSMMVPITTSGLFRVRKTATNTYTVYRIC